MLVSGLSRGGGHTAYEFHPDSFYAVHDREGHTEIGAFVGVFDAGNLEPSPVERWEDLLLPQHVLFTPCPGDLEYFAFPAAAKIQAEDMAPGGSADMGAWDRSIERYSDPDRQLRNIFGRISLMFQ